MGTLGGKGLKIEKIDVALPFYFNKDYCVYLDWMLKSLLKRLFSPCLSLNEDLRAPYTTPISNSNPDLQIGV